MSMERYSGGPIGIPSVGNIPSECTACKAVGTFPPSFMQVQMPIELDPDLEERSKQRILCPKCIDKVIKAATGPKTAKRHFYDD